jgi:lipopolysaccharide transport system permease protein
VSSPASAPQSAARPEPALPVEVVDERPSLRGTIRDAWRQRRLVPRIGIRVTVKGYSGTKLGRSWLWLRPTLSLLGMSLLFGAVLDTPSQGVPYILFLLVGTHAWMGFERTLFWSTRSFDVYRRLTRNFRFPLVLAPVGALIPATIEFTVVAGLVTVVSAYFLAADGEVYLQLGPDLVVALAGYALAYMVGLAFGLWTATLNAYARDVRLTLIFVIQIWLFITPVIYPFERLPESLRPIAILNPVTAPVEMVKHGLLGIGGVHLDALASTFAALVIVGGSGLWFLERQGPSLLRRQPPGAEDDEDI